MQTRMLTWAVVANPRQLRALRAAGGIDAVVVGGPTPIYGRPGEVLVVRLDPVPGRDPGTVIAGLPVRAGVLVPATPEGLAVVESLALRRRQPRAVLVRAPADVRRALDAGATHLVAELGQAEAILALGGPLPLLVQVRDGAERGRAVGLGAVGVVVPADLVTESAEGRVGSVRRLGAGATILGPRPGGAPTIGDLFMATVRRHPEVEAVVHLRRGRRLSYAELGRAVDAVARSLIAADVAPGDRVAILARNVPEWPIVQLASAVVGVVLVTVNPSLAEDEVRFVLGNSGSKLLLASPRDAAQQSLLEALVADRPQGLERAVLIESSGVTPPVGIDAWSSFLRDGESASPAAVRQRARRVRPDDVAAILYTSGTTGRPKGAMLTHRGLVENAAAVAANLGLGPTDRLCLAVPFHHCFGSVMGTLGAVTAGTTLVVPDDWFDPAAVLDAIERERCTVLYGVPTMFIALLAEASRRSRDLRSLRTGIIAGAPVDPALAERAARELHIPELVVAYGLTEASPVITQTARTDPPEIRLGTVGRPIPGAAVRIVDPSSGADVPDGQPGELVTRGPMVMAGYFGDPAGTAAAIDADGWLHTGDLAVRAPSGVVRIVGRLKEMIIRGGENVYPAEIEAVGRRHPGVTDVAVVGVPSSYFGEEIAAFVVVAPGETVSADELRRHFAEHLAPFKIPRWIHFVDSLPMTASGKVKKDVLRARAEALAQGSGDGGVGASAGSGLGPMAGPRPPLPLLPSKAVPGLARLDAADRARSLEGAGTGPDPTAGPGPCPPTPPGPPLRLPDRPPRRGWIRPAVPAWVWRLRAAEGSLAGPTRSMDADHATGQEMTTQQLQAARRRGQRIKTWGIGGDVRRQIEATGEHPIMYRALGTPPQRTHPFNLYWDIRSQPEALRGTFETASEIAEVARRIAERRPVGAIGLGSGTSQFVAQVANAALARFAGIPGWDYDSLHFLRYPPPVDFTRFVAFAYSGSGSTVDTVAAARHCRAAGALTVAFTSVDGSPVVEASDARILTAGGFDTGGSDTFHYTTRVAASIYLALELGKRLRPGAEAYDRLQGELVATAEAMERIFDDVEARCRTIAERFLDVRAILVVGAGPNYGTAEEIALKFDEMAHIPTKAMNPGRHIHGALGLTDEQILTVLVAPPGPSYGEMVSLAKVTEILKTPSVAIVSEDDTEVADRCDYVIRLPATDEAVFAVLAVLPGQLLPYWCGVGLGLNPDTQRSNIPKHAKVWNMLFPPGTH